MIEPSKFCWTCECFYISRKNMEASVNLAWFYETQRDCENAFDFMNGMLITVPFYGKTTDVPGKFDGRHVIKVVRRISLNAKFEIEVMVFGLHCGFKLSELGGMGHLTDYPFAKEMFNEFAASSTMPYTKMTVDRAATALVYRARFARVMAGAAMGNLAMDVDCLFQEDPSPTEYAMAQKFFIDE